MRTLRRRSKSRSSTRATSIGSARRSRAGARTSRSRFPLGLDYRTVRGLSSEVQHKLNLHKPETIGQAARISGVTPAAISLLLVHLKRGLAQRRCASRRRSGPRRVDDADARPRRPCTRCARARVIAIDIDSGLAELDAVGGVRAAPRSARQARRLSRSPREMESHVQPDRDTRAGENDHASRPRFPRRPAASARARRIARLVAARRRQRRRRSGAAARDRAARVARRGARQQPQEGRVSAAGGDRARAGERRSDRRARRGLPAGSAFRRRHLARVLRSRDVRRIECPAPRRRRPPRCDERRASRRGDRAAAAGISRGLRRARSRCRGSTRRGT